MSSSASIISSSSSSLSSSSSSSSPVLSPEKPLPSIESTDVCSICRDEFLDTSAKTRLVFHISCHNYFHKDCIVTALKINERCPICRGKTDDLNTKQVELGSDRQIALITGENLPKVDEQAQIAYRQWVSASFEGQDTEQMPVPAPPPVSPIPWVHALPPVPITWMARPREYLNLHMSGVLTLF